MKQVLKRLVPWFLPACMVNTPIVEGENDRLGKELPAWCESMCDRFVGCGAPNDPEACPDDCAKLFNDTFVGRGDVCSDGALRIMDCIDGLPCSGTSISEACAIEQEADLCAISQGQVVCHGEDLGEGGKGAAGGTAGQAGVAGLSCEVEVSDCSDGSSYRLSCNGPLDAPLCRCWTDLRVTKTFVPEGLECLAGLEAVEVCDWPVTRISDQSGAEGAVCSAYEASGPGGSGFECVVSFADCMNDHEYGLECGVSGSTSCTCLLDGIDFGSFPSAALICPYVSAESDSGVLAVYEACGFEISVL